MARRGPKKEGEEVSRDPDLRLIRLVLDDLEDIEADTCQNATGRQLRRASVPLRRLLVDNGGGIFKKAWSQIFPKGPSLKIMSSRLERGRCVGNGLAVALETNLPEGRLFYTQISYEPAAFLHNPHIVELMSLSTFLNSHVMYAPGIWLSRVQFIKYVANKAGGVHFDASLEEHEVKMLELAEYSFLGGVNCVDLAIKATGQTVANDAMVRRWVTAARHL